jgi:hypothetical protein
MGVYEETGKGVEGGRRKKDGRYGSIHNEEQIKGEN